MKTDNALKNKWKIDTNTTKLKREKDKANLLIERQSESHG